jgi:hypothetical protein
MFICCGFFFPPIKIHCVINLYFFDHMAIEFYSYTINVEISWESMNLVWSLSPSLSLKGKTLGNSIIGTSQTNETKTQVVCNEHKELKKLQETANMSPLYFYFLKNETPLCPNKMPRHNHKHTSWQPTTQAIPGSHTDQMAKMCASLNIFS